MAVKEVCHVAFLLAVLCLFVGRVGGVTAEQAEPESGGDIDAAGTAAGAWLSSWRVGIGSVPGISEMEVGNAAC